MLQAAWTNDCDVFVLSNIKETQNTQNKTRYPILDILFIVIHYSGGDDGVIRMDFVIPCPQRSYNFLMSNCARKCANPAIFALARIRISYNLP